VEFKPTKAPPVLFTKKTHQCGKPYAGVLRESGVGEHGHHTGWTSLSRKRRGSRRLLPSRRLQRARLHALPGGGTGHGRDDRRARAVTAGLALLLRSFPEEIGAGWVAKEARAGDGPFLWRSRGRTHMGIRDHSTANHPMAYSGFRSPNFSPKKSPGFQTGRSGSLATSWAIRKSSRACLTAASKFIGWSKSSLGVW
jgi:hypothetical protein